MSGTAFLVDVDDTMPDNDRIRDDVCNHLVRRHGAAGGAGVRYAQ